MGKGWFMKSSESQREEKRARERERENNGSRRRHSMSFTSLFVCFMAFQGFFAWHFCLMWSVLRATGRKEKTRWSLGSQRSGTELLLQTACVHVRVNSSLSTPLLLTAPLQLAIHLHTLVLEIIRKGGWTKRKLIQIKIRSSLMLLLGTVWHVARHW